MESDEFRIEEVNRDGYIAWDAVHTKTGERFPVNTNSPYTAGHFPEITEYLKNIGINFEVKYVMSLRDTFTGPNDGCIWKYTRGDREVRVHDIPRTLSRIGVGART